MKTTFIRFAKTTALAAFMFIAFTMSAFAKPIEVNDYLIKQFESQFRGASNVTWKTTAQFTSASFMQNGQKVSVFYNSQSDLIGVSKTITVTELPKKAQQTLTARYNDYTVVSVIDFTNEEGVESYYIQLDNKGKQIILQSDEFGSVTDFQK